MSAAFCQRTSWSPSSSSLRFGYRPSPIKARPETAVCKCIADSQESAAWIDVPADIAVAGLRAGYDREAVIVERPDRGGGDAPVGLLPDSGSHVAGPQQQERAVASNRWIRIPRWQRPARPGRRWHLEISHDALTAEAELAMNDVDIVDEAGSPSGSPRPELGLPRGRGQDNEPRVRNPGDPHCPRERRCQDSRLQRRQAHPHADRPAMTQARRSPLRREILNVGY